MKIKKGLALAVVIALLLTMNAFADTGSWLRVNGLGIMVGDENGDLHENDRITRAEFAAICCRMVGADNLEKADTPFYDVTKEHWGSGYISAAASMGAIEGIGNGIFAPEESITYTQALKIIVAVLGYGTEADKMGGYPNGYIAQAGALRLTRGVDISGDFAIRKVIAKILDNALDVHPAKQIYANAGGYELDDRTLYEILTQSGKEVTEFEGIMTECAATSLTQISPTIKNKRVRVNGIELCANNGEEKYLGYYVSGYARINDNGEAEIVSILPKGSKNNETKALCGDVVLSSTSATVYKDSEIKTLRIDGNAAYVKNGRLLQNPSEDEKDIEYGEYAFLDNDGDNSVDVVFIKSGASFIVEKVDEEKNTVYFGNDLRYKGKNGITVDYDKADMFISVTDTNGNPLTLGDIKIGNAVTVFTSDDTEVLQMCVSDKTESGVISAIGGKKYTINSTEYEKAENNTAVYRLDESAIFSVDMYGRIAGSTEKQYNAHIAGTADKHSGSDVMYSPSKSVNAKIDELVITGGGGTMYHDELLNRSNAQQHPISAITGLSDYTDRFITFSGVIPANSAGTEILSQSVSSLLTDGRLVLPFGHFFTFDVCAHFFRDMTVARTNLLHKVVRQTIAATYVDYAVNLPLIIQTEVPPTVTVADTAYNVTGTYPQIISRATPDFVGDSDVSLTFLRGDLVEDVPDNAICLTVSNQADYDVTACVSVQVLTHYVSPDLE